MSATTVKLDKRTPEEIEKDEKTRICCRLFWGWFFQILVWSSFALFISMYAVNGNKIEIGYWIQFIVVYIAYYIYCCCTRTFKYLLHFRKGATVYSYMGSLFYKPAYVDFHIACYHMETRRYKSGKTWKTRREKVVTYEGKETFKYMSWRDISGMFQLDTTGFAKDPSRSLVKLKLGLSMEFPDDGTAFDYECQRQYFIDKNKHRDVSYDFFKKTRMDDFEEFNMVSIDGKTGLTINLGFYLLSSLIMLVEFYKLYVDSYCTYQTFEIKKLVSTKTNLNQPENFQSYLPRIPGIRIKEEVVFNDQSKLGEVTVVPDLPEYDEVIKGELMKKASGLLGPGPDIHYDPDFHPPEENDGNHSSSKVNHEVSSAGIEYNSSNNNQLTVKLNPGYNDSNINQGYSNANYGYQSPAIEQQSSSPNIKANNDISSQQTYSSYGYNQVTNDIIVKTNQSAELANNKP